MGTVAKSYYITHHNHLVIKTSSWRRPFDDMYDEFNGLLSSENLSSYMAWPSDRVAVNDTAGHISATSLTVAMQQVVPDGYHDIHFLAYGTKLCVMPGRAEVNGTVCRVKDRMNLEVTAVTFITGSLTIDTIIGVYLNETTVATASDVFFMAHSNATLTGKPNLGLYESGTRRAMYSFVYTDNSKCYDHEFYTPPVNNHFYILAYSEGQVHPMFEDSYITASNYSDVYAGSAITRINCATRFFNHSTWRYDWNLRISPGGVTDAQNGGTYRSTRYHRLGEMYVVGISAIRQFRQTLSNSGTYSLNMSTTEMDNSGADFDIEIRNYTTTAIGWSLQLKLSAKLTAGALTDG